MKSSPQSQPQSMRQKILHSLSDGPLTMREIADQIGSDIDSVRCAIGSLRNRNPRILHIHSYRRDTDGGRLYPRAVWALGAGKDAKRPPKLTSSEYNKRAKTKRRVCLASIFHIGLVNDSVSSRLRLSKSFTITAPQAEPQCAAHIATASRTPSSAQKEKSEALL